MIEFDDYQVNERAIGSHVLRRTNPFGFWVVLDSKGREVSGINGVFTNPQSAAQALTNHLKSSEKKK